VKNIGSGFYAPRTAWACIFFVREESFVVLANGSMICDEACHPCACGVEESEVGEPSTALLVERLKCETVVVGDLEEVFSFSV